MVMGSFRSSALRYHTQNGGSSGSVLRIGFFSGLTYPRVARRVSQHSLWARCAPCRLVGSWYAAIPIGRSFLQIAHTPLRVVIPMYAMFSDLRLVIIFIKVGILRYYLVDSTTNSKNYCSKWCIQELFHYCSSLYGSLLYTNYNEHMSSCMVCQVPVDSFHESLIQSNCISKCERYQRLWICRKDVQRVPA